MNQNSKISSDRVSELHYPRLTSKSKNCALLYCFPTSLSSEDINRVLTEYDVRQSFLYKCDNDYGVAFLYKSVTEKGRIEIKEIKEICIDRTGHIAEDGEISMYRKRLSSSKYFRCSEKDKESLSGKELMKGMDFVSLPCPFGLHLRYEKPCDSIIRLLDDEVSALITAACDPKSIYIAANEEQLLGDIGKKETTGSKIVYYPKYGEYEKALNMKNKLAEQYIKIGVSSFMEETSFAGKNIGCDISDFIRQEMKMGKVQKEVMERIFATDPELVSSGLSLW